MKYTTKGKKIIELDLTHIIHVHTDIYITLQLHFAPIWNVVVPYNYSLVITWWLFDS